MIWPPPRLRRAPGAPTPNGADVSVVVRLGFVTAREHDLDLVEPVRDRGGELDRRLEVRMHSSGERRPDRRASDRYERRNVGRVLVRRRRDLKRADAGRLGRDRRRRAVVAGEVRLRADHARRVRPGRRHAGDAAGALAVRRGDLLLHRAVRLLLRQVGVELAGLEAGGDRRVVDQREVEERLDVGVARSHLGELACSAAPASSRRLR